MEIETWLTQDLNKPVKVQSISGNLFSQDNMANLIGVEIMDGNQPATVSGIVSANVLRADGATVAVTGTLIGNKASVVLPQSAYLVPGMTAIVIKLIDDEEVTTIGAVQAIVYRSSTEEVIDPGTIMPDIQSLIEYIDTVRESIPQEYSELSDQVETNTGKISDIEDSIGEVPEGTTVEGQLSGKADKSNTVLSNTLSMGRKANTTVGTKSFAFGDNVEASGAFSYAEGKQTKATASCSHAEGNYTTASGIQSHAGGNVSKAIGDGSFAYGFNSEAKGDYSVAFGTQNIEMTSYPDWESGTLYHVGDIVIRNGSSSYRCIQENEDTTFNGSHWERVPWSTKEAFVIGNGEDSDSKSNAFEVCWDGTAKAGGKELAHVEDILTIEVNDHKLVITNNA